jgi:hypothetical protein
VAVVTNIIAYPAEVPQIPVGPPTLNWRSFFPVYLYNAKNMLDSLNFISTGSPNALNGYGFPRSVLCHANSNPLVTRGETRVGNSVENCHFILPVLMSGAVMVPLSIPFRVILNSGTRYLLSPLTK